ncbi:unnamed protein product [Choristocarpus tenellus]
MRIGEWVNIIYFFIIFVVLFFILSSDYGVRGPNTNFFVVVVGSALLFRGGSDSIFVYIIFFVFVLGYQKGFQNVYSYYCLHFGQKGSREKLFLLLSLCWSEGVPKHLFLLSLYWSEGVPKHLFLLFLHIGWRDPKTMHFFCFLFGLVGGVPKPVLVEIP